MIGIKLQKHVHVIYYRFILPDILLTKTASRVRFAPLATGREDIVCLMLVSTTPCWSGKMVWDVKGTPAMVYISGSSSRLHSVFLLGLADLQRTNVGAAKLVGQALGSGPAPGDLFLAHGTFFPAKKSTSCSMVPP
jgi:hypothetical protein